MKPEPRQPGGQPGNQNAAKEEVAEGHIHLRVPLAKKGEWVRVARARGQTLSEFIVASCDDVAGR
jgi:hypothetical protein